MSTHVDEWAPIGLDIYKRAEHARRTIVNLQSCDGADSSPIWSSQMGQLAQVRPTSRWSLVMRSRWSCFRLIFAPVRIDVSVGNSPEFRHRTAWLHTCDRATKIGTIGLRLRPLERGSGQ